jgi:EAL domain-containing protein (putative c-di-GMP-specific phosphodiesterase class I)
LQKTAAFRGRPRPHRRGVAVDEALRNNWLEIWYQPKIDLKRKCLAGAEALARIRHPQEGMLWPDSFLPGIDDSLALRTSRARHAGGATDAARTLPRTAASAQG